MGRQIIWFPAAPFLHTAFEYQYWGTGSGLCASAESTSHIFLVVSTAWSYAEQVMFNLVGFNVGAGIIYKRCAATSYGQATDRLGRGYRLYLGEALPQSGAATAHSAAHPDLAALAR